MSELAGQVSLDEGLTSVHELDQIAKNAKSQMHPVIIKACNGSKFIFKYLSSKTSIEPKLIFWPEQINTINVGK